MQRARKKDLKPKKKNDEKPSEEIMDQMRYLGAKIFENNSNNNNNQLMTATSGRKSNKALAITSSATRS